ncbi:MAG: hypothetical protein LBR57_01015 [Alistipes sp.]|jgi:hypothetical protein|nr:hypothetical protein [Alistipes sp.]
MNEVFDLKRFGAYAARSWSLWAKKYLVHASVYAGIMLVFLVISYLAKLPSFSLNHLTELVKFWLSPLIIFWTITFSIVLMGPLKNRHTMALENTAPASTTEKWLFVLLNGTVGAAVMFLVMTAVITLLGVAAIGSFEGVGQLIPKPEWWGTLALMIVTMQATILFTGSLERKNHVAACILFWLTVLFVFLMLTIFPMWISETFDTTPQWGPMFLFSEASVPGSLSEVTFHGQLFDLTESSVLNFLRWLGIAATLILWVCSWFNFKERSIK